jgi:hypothetical protein
MVIRRNAVLTAIATAGVLFIGLLIARMPTVVALPVALVVGGVVLAAVSRSPSAAPIAPSPVVITPDPPPPPQYQAQQVAGIPLPSAHGDYLFVFSATVYWLPIATNIPEPGMIAASEIIRRARELTQQGDPARAALISHELAALLTDARPDPAGRVRARAESVHLLLSADDQRRLDEIARLRKEEELWEHQRRHEESKRRYLGADVLKDPGSAVVWWLARNDGQPEKVAESIDVLTRLAHAANNTDDDPAGNAARTGDEASIAEPGNPQTPAEHFGAFVDSLSLRDDARLMLTKQMASLMKGYGYSTVAREMTGTYDEWAGDGSGMPGEGPGLGDW